VELAAGHGVKNLGPRAAMIGEEVGAALRLHLGLVLHVLSAAGEKEQARDSGEESCSPTLSQSARKDGARSFWGYLSPNPCSLFPVFEVVHQYSTSTTEFGLNFSK
jgi:hypothetical protein